MGPLSSGRIQRQLDDECGPDVGLGFKVDGSAVLLAARRSGGGTKGNATPNGAAGDNRFLPERPSYALM